MKRRNKISFSFLLLVSCVFGYILNEFTPDNKHESQQPKVEVVVDAVRGELLATEVIANTVNNKKENLSKVTERIVAFPIKNRNPRVLGRNEFFIRDTISAVEPKYLMSYYTELLSEVRIRSPMPEIIHHMAVALQKQGTIHYVCDFINNAYTNPIVWRRALIVHASDCSP